MDQPSKTTRKRFPRLLSGSQTAAFKMLAWTQPQFSVKVKKHSPAVEFRFTVQFPEKIGRLYPPLETLFFGPGAELFEDGLAKAYWKGVSGKDLSRFIPNLLHLVFQNAIDQWLRDCWKYYPENAGPQIADYFTQAKKKRGRQPDPNQALWTVRRIENLQKDLKAVRQSYKKQKRDGRSMWNSCAHITSREVLEAALKKLVGNSNIDAVFADRRVSEERITRTILEIELHKKYPEASRQGITLKKYLKLGGEIRAALSDLHRSRQLKTPS